MFTTLLILMIIVAVLLIVIVLIQNPKGGGLSSEFGGSSSQMFGVQRTNDLLEKLTWGFFAFIVIGSLASGVFFKPTTGSRGNSELDVESTQAAPLTPAAPNALPNTAPVPAPATPATPAPATPAPSSN